MKKTVLILTCLAVVTMMSFSVFAEDHTIVGEKKCSTCHKKAKYGNQTEVWATSAHANAYETLKSEESIAIAKEKGLGNPWEEASCLKCHTTQAFLGAELNVKGKYVIEEGVSCEACHGAGSDYKKKSIMKDHDAAVAAGLRADVTENCVECHNEDSPTYEAFDYDARWEEIKHALPEK
ncbi:MAG: cytochrome C554 [bacterium]|nr:cytochrome C554 [bacterium]MCP4800921.1 cytochrome C554 [bacterium]